MEMDIYRKKSNTSDFLFFIGWFLFMSSYTLLRESELMYLIDTSNIYKILKVIFVSIFCVKIAFIDKYNLKTLLLYFFVIGISFIGSQLVDSDIIFFTLLIAFSARNVNFDKFVKFDLMIRITMVLLIMLLCYLGILPNFTRLINSSFKQSLGFSHPNILGLNIITILLEYMYLNKRVNIVFIIINISALLFLNYACNSRTSIYAYVFILFLYVFIKNKEKVFNFKLIKLIICFLPAIMLLTSFALVKGYQQGNEIIHKIDELVTTRISSASNFYNEYGINLKGSKVTIVSTRQSIITGEKQRILDMGYLRMAINYGLITCFMIIILLITFQFVIYKNNNMKLLLISTFFLIIGLMETNIYNIAFNFSLIQFVNLISDKNSNMRRISNGES